MSPRRRSVTTIPVAGTASMKANQMISRHLSPSPSLACNFSLFPRRIPRFKMLRRRSSSALKRLAATSATESFRLRHQRRCLLLFQEVFNIKMSSRRGWKTPFAGPSNSTQKGKGIGPHYGQPSGDSRAGNTNTGVDRLTHDVGNMSGYYIQDGDWKVSRNKFKNQAGNNAVKQWVTRGSTTNNPQQPNDVQESGMSINSAPGKPKGVVWQTQTVNEKRTNGIGKINDQRYNTGFDAPPTVVAPPLQHRRQWGGRGGPAHRTNGIGEVNDQRYNTGFDAPPTVVAPPLQHGWQSGGRGGPAHVNLGQCSGEDFECNVGGRQNQSDINEDDHDYSEEDDDELTSDDFDKQIKPLFDMLDKLTVKQLNDDLSRALQCPACYPGPGSSDWYKGLQALMNHAKTTVVRRVKLHRKLAELLGEELNQRGTSVIPVVGASGKWCGLREAVFDREIVWPPMVVVMNTKFEKDEHGEWSGMGNQDLLDYFRSYEAVKARHSYGPDGHRGMSLLIFESSSMGYLEADRLDNHFANQQIHRSQWEDNYSRFHHGGTRQLYGYMACRADLDYFNKHTQGKSIVKYEMRSYQEMVVVPLKQMNEDNQQLINFQNKYFEAQKCVTVLKKSVALLYQGLKKTIEENRNIDFLEGLFKEYTNQFQEVLEQKEREDFKALSLEGEQVKQSNADSGTWEDAELS